MITIKLRLDSSRVKGLLRQEQSNEKKMKNTETPVAKESETKSKTKIKEDKPKDVNELRTVIKVGQQTEEKQPQGEQEDQAKEKTAIAKKPETQAVNGHADVSTQKKDLENRREYLKAFKDFDFRINENKEKISLMVEKINNLSGDLDDLVSLYEIVSEQMNPFVGLSKVTKERIDTLENYTNEIKELKERIERIEFNYGIADQDMIEKKETSEHLEKTLVAKKQDDTPLQPTPLKMIDKTCSDDELDRILEESLRTLQPLKNIEREINEFLNAIS